MTRFDPPSPSVLASARPLPEGLAGPAGLADTYGRTVSYLRVSVTDRCDLRCVYCMPKNMKFLPRAEVLSLEELERLCTVFIGEGVRKLRLTGGEPLVRRGLLDLIGALSRHLRSGALEELALTTNGTRLAEFARPLAECGVRRVNVSIDSLNPDVFARLTRGGRLAGVLEGLDRAAEAGLKVRINTVALAGDNRGELAGIIAFAHERGFDVAFIETMPLGEVEADRSDQYLSLETVRREIAAVWTLEAEPNRSGGPARTFRVRETGGRVGFITPISDNFCATCNRVRLTCTGVLHTCLGHEEGEDLRTLLRGGADDDALREAIRGALRRKPKAHDFRIARGTAPSLARHMSTTGG